MFQIRPPPFMPKSDIKIAVTEAEAKQEEKTVNDGKHGFLFTEQMRSLKKRVFAFLVPLSSSFLKYHVFR